MVLSKFKSPSLWVSLLIMVVLIALIFNPEIYMQSTFNGIIVWATAVLPALFPFFFLTKLLTQLGYVEKISRIFEPITSKLFNCSGVSSYVFLMSVISGYPVGAKLTSELYENNIISQTQAVRMCSFCSTSGPLFIIGTVGIEMFLNKTIGLIMIASHILGAIINGLCFRFYKKNEPLIKHNISKPQNIGNLLSNTIYDSIISILIVGGYIALFFMLIDVFSNFYILTSLKYCISQVLLFFGIDAGFATGITSGIIEVTRGCLELSKENNLFWGAIFGIGLISWGGFSIHFQALTFLKKCKIKIGFYFFQKLLHCIFSMLICWAILSVFNI